MCDRDSISMDCDSDKNWCSESKDKCSCNYLKPLTIEKLFSGDICDNFEDTLEKTKKLRNAFFAAKAAIHNYVNDVEKITDDLLTDASDNEVELDSARQSYFTAVNTLNTTLYTALKVTHKNKNLINLDLHNVKNFNRGRLQRSKDLVLNTGEDKNPLSITNVPGVTIQIYPDTKLTKINFSEPETVFASKYSLRRKNKDVVTSYILTPSVYCFDTLLSLDEPLSDDTIDEDCTLQHGINNDTFQNLDFAKDYLEEIQNYHDNYIIDNNSSTNQILQVVNALDKYMNKIENTHKYVVQLCKIYNDY